MNRIGAWLREWLAPEVPEGMVKGFRVECPTRGDADWLTDDGLITHDCPGRGR